MEITLEALLMVAGGLLAGLGVLLPWAEITAVFVGTLSVKGLDVETVGLLCGAAGAALVVVGGLWIAGHHELVFGWLGAAAGLAILAIAGWKYLDVQTVIDDMNREADGFGRATVGVGLYVTLLGGALGLGGGIAAIAKPRSRTF